jgi:hypothetical protein
MPCSTRQWEQRLRVLERALINEAAPLCSGILEATAVLNTPMQFVQALGDNQISNRRQAI